MQCSNSLPNLTIIQLHARADGACVRGQDLPPARTTVDLRLVRYLAPEPQPDPRIHKKGLPADLSLSLAPM